MEQDVNAIQGSLKQVFEEQNINLKLYEFYERICSGIYKYVIIIPRKCLTEYKCVKQAYPDLKVNEKTTFMTTKGFIRYRDKIKKEIETMEELPDNYLAIVDDIMIYGRGINHFLTRMLNSLGSEEAGKKLIKKTYLEIFIESNFDFELDPQYQEILDERYNCFFSYSQYSSIKRASDLFMKSFYAIAVPNTSFIRAWYLSPENTEKWLTIEEGKVGLGTVIKDNTDFKIIEAEPNAAQQAERFHLGFIYSRTQFLDNLCEFKCLRYYHNENLNRTVFVPYVLLKPLSMRETDDLLEAFCGLLGDLVPDKSDLLTRYENDEDYSILKYEYLTQIISDLYGLYLWKDDFIETNSYFMNEREFLKYSFGDENAYCLSELSEILSKTYGKSWYKTMEDRIGSFQVKECDIFSSEEEKEAQKIIKQMSDNVRSVPDRKNSELSKWFVENFFERTGRNDEIRAKNNEDRIYGISIESFYRTFSEIVKNPDENDKISFYKEIIKCMDSGIAGVRIKAYKISEETYIASVLNQGEQSYRIKIDPYMLLFKYCKKIENDCINLHISNTMEERIDKFLCDATEDEADDRRKIREDIAYIREGMQRQRSSYSDMFVDRSEDRKDINKEQKYEEIYHKVMA